MLKVSKMDLRIYVVLKLCLGFGFDFTYLNLYSVVNYGYLGHMRETWKNNHQLQIEGFSQKAIQKCILETLFPFVSIKYSYRGITFNTIIYRDFLS